MRVYKVSINEEDEYVVGKDDIQAIFRDVEDAKTNDVIKIEVVEMDQDEYLKLPFAV